MLFSSWPSVSDWNAMITVPLKPYVAPAFNAVASRLHPSVGYWINRASPGMVTHVGLILAASLFFTAMSWGIYYGMAPRLITRHVRKHYEKMGGRRSSVEFVPKGNIRPKMAHIITSLVHALLVTAGSLYCVLNDTSANNSYERVFAIDDLMTQIVILSTGYFIWDLFVCVYYFRLYGKGFLVHATMACMATLVALRPCLSYYAVRFLLFELSTIFVDLHWLLEKLGWEDGLLIKINDFCVLLAYFFIRICYGYFCTWNIYLDLDEQRGYLSPSVRATVLGFNFMTHYLNAIWFYRLIRSAYRSIYPKKPKNKRE